MGKLNNVMNRYLSDERHFADLFNGILFQGEGIISPENLQDCSERYITEAVSVITSETIDWQREKHKFKNEKGEYDMGNAWREWFAEEREAGRQEGRQEGVFETL